MPKGFFVTATDTGVGKTVITAALIKIARTDGIQNRRHEADRNRLFKSKLQSPESKVEVQNKNLIPADGLFLKEMAGMDDFIDLVTPIRFENPLAPLAASEIEGTQVDLEKIKRAYSILSDKYDVVIVEGIGGLLVPISKDYFIIDLAKDFGLPLIVVARPGLGTINHTLLTVNYAIKEGVHVAGIIINYGQPPLNTQAEHTNPKTMKQISPVPIIGIFPHLEDLSSGAIQKAAIKNLNFEILKKYL